MKPVNITNESFEREVLQSTQLTVLDLWAPWCGPCKMIGPILDDIATRFEGQLKVKKLNVDENSETSQRYGITSISTLIFFRDGKIVDRITGAVSRNQFETRVNRLLNDSVTA